MIALANPGVFWTYQGEAHLLGMGMAFVRLAGCSVGCPTCDTDYSVEGRYGVDEIVEAVETETPDGADRWAFITGGEPTDQKQLPELIQALKKSGHSVGLATSGVRKVRTPVDWLSVSPHSNAELAQRFGHELKVVPGLNGFDDVRAWIRENESTVDFWFRYFMPHDADPDGVDVCLELAREFPRWGVTVQAHKLWGIA